MIAAAAATIRPAPKKFLVILEWNERDCVQWRAVGLGRGGIGSGERVQIEMGQLLKNLLVFLVTEEGNAGVLVAPDPVHDGERDEHAGGSHRVNFPELAFVDPSANDAAEQSEAAA